MRDSGSLLLLCFLGLSAIGCASTDYVEPDPAEGPVATIIAEYVERGDRPGRLGPRSISVSVFSADGLCARKIDRMSDVFLGAVFFNVRPAQFRVVADRPVFFHISSAEMNQERAGTCDARFGFLPAAERTYKVLIEQDSRSSCSIVVVNEAGAEIRLVKPSRCFRDVYP